MNGDDAGDVYTLVFAMTGEINGCLVWKIIGNMKIWPVKLKIGREKGVADADEDYV